MSATNSSPPSVSIIIPAKNEAAGLRQLLPAMRAQYPLAEILVVNDGSADETPEVCLQHKVKIVNHVYGMGNGAAIKSGARAATGELLVFMDADGQHSPEDIPLLLDKLAMGFTMVVGARSQDSQASVWRYLANSFYSRLASWMTGHTILDLTSGFRAARAAEFREFLHLLPNGFSYPTTITMAFFRAGYTVSYVPIQAGKRIGSSHINAARDGLRFLLIIFRIGTLYSPLKLFFPISMFFLFTGMFYYAYTFFTIGRFTNMSALLFSTSVLVFLIGLVSEQITNLIYSRRND